MSDIKEELANFLRDFAEDYLNRDVFRLSSDHIDLHIKQLLELFHSHNYRKVEPEKLPLLGDEEILHASRGLKEFTVGQWAVDNGERRLVKAQRDAILKQLKVKL